MLLQLPTKRASMCPCLVDSLIREKRTSCMCTHACGAMRGQLQSVNTLAELETPAVVLTCAVGDGDANTTTTVNYDDDDEEPATRLSHRRSSLGCQVHCHHSLTE